MKKATIAEVYAVATILQIMAEEQPPPFPYDGAHKMLLGPTYVETNANTGEAEDELVEQVLNQFRLMIRRGLCAK